MTKQNIIGTTLLEVPIENIWECKETFLDGKKYQDRETHKEEDIVYPDLVFTLQRDNRAYSKPLTFFCPSSKKLIAIANKHFLRAAREAGLKRIISNVFILNGQNQIGIALATRSIPAMPFIRETVKDFLFYQGVPHIDLLKVHKQNPEIKRAALYESAHCLQVEYPDVGYPERTETLMRLLNQVAKPHLLRSLNGLKPAANSSYKPFMVYGKE